MAGLVGPFHQTDHCIGDQFIESGLKPFFWAAKPVTIKMIRGSSLRAVQGRRDIIGFNQRERWAAYAAADPQGFQKALGERSFACTKIA